MLSVGFTPRRGEATIWCGARLREGHSEIVAVGGDGTINEAVNGFFNADGALAPDAVLASSPAARAAISARRSASEAGPEAAMARFEERAQIKPVDVGRVSCLSARRAADGAVFHQYRARSGFRE